jgi:formylglycine-generating enzyme required for sulfatase activity
LNIEDGDSIRSNKLGMEFIKVKAGSFLRGLKDNLHKVTLTNDYYIGKYPVTQAQWEKIMDNNPSSFKGADLPVQNVSWNDCQDFIQKLKDITGKNYQLPSEAEWEFAARGGIFSKGYVYAGSDELDSVAWFNNNSNEEAHPVGQKKANELGIYDMCGNVWEWCQDWHEEYIPSDQINPSGPSDGAYRVFRGGCWYCVADYCLVAYRSGGIPDCWDYSLGFRLLSLAE